MSASSVRNGLKTIGESNGAPRLMPDIALEHAPHVAGQIDRVGMSGIEIPVRLRTADGRVFNSLAKADAFVSLDDPATKGIHMSRLYLHLQKTLDENELNFATLEKLVRGFQASHSAISDNAFAKLSFDYLIRRAALVSDNEAWRSYPITLAAALEDGRLSLEVGVVIAYSSTCPCSAALSRQVIQEGFDEDFAGQANIPAAKMREWLGLETGIRATPHSQRSFADVRICVDPESKSPEFPELIDMLESALITVVQAAVKREDEQAFASLNAENLMFCEDAARRIKSLLEKDGRIVDYWARIDHHESLHPHNAVAIVTKSK